MKSVCLFFLSLLIFFPFSGNTVALDQGQFVGTYAFDGFFNDNAVLQQLRSFLSSNQFKKIKNELTAQNPIRREGQFLIIEGCKPHACPDENYTLFINLKEKKGFLGIWKARNIANFFAYGQRGKIRGNMTFYGSHFSEPLVFKDLQADFGCSFIEEALKEFIENVSSLSDEHEQKETLRKFVQKGLRINS